ncbi:uncharacterized protein PHA67_015015 isoform 2-T2 [Liasis olivaceus]
MFAMYALVPKVEEEEEEEENRRRRRRRVCVTEWKRKSLLGTFAKAESGCLSLLSRLGPVPRAAEEPETPLPLQLAGVSKEWKLVRRKDYLAKIWRSLLKSGFWKSLWSKLQQLIGLIPFIPKSFLVFGEMTRNIAVHLSLPKIDLPVGWGRFGDPLQATTDQQSVPSLDFQIYSLPLLTPETYVVQVVGSIFVQVRLVRRLPFFSETRLLF